MVPRGMGMGSGGDSTMRNFILRTIRLIRLVRLLSPIRLRWAGYVARMEESRSAFKILTGNPTRKRPS